MGKWTVINWDMGVDGIEEWYSSRDEAMAYCEEHSGCDTAACDEKNVLDHDHCERNSFQGYIHQHDSHVMTVSEFKAHFTRSLWNSVKDSSMVI